MLLEPHLKTLAEELELDGAPQRQPGNTFQLDLNPMTQIVLQEQDPGFSLWGRIGSCPTVKKEELFMLLMKANFLGQGTGGACIGLEEKGEKGNFLTLSSVFPYDMSYKHFREALEDFANYLDYWRDELIRHKKAAEESIL